MGIDGEDPIIIATMAQATGNQNSDNGAAEVFAARELRGRAFTLADAIGKVGAGLLAGDAAVPRPLRARARLEGFIDQHLVDGPGGLRAVLRQTVREDLRISRDFEAPFGALEAILQELAQEPAQLHEFARRVAVVQGELYGERPVFQRPGEPPQAGADYCHDSIREALLALGERVRVRSDWPVERGSWWA